MMTALCRGSRIASATRRSEGRERHRNGHAGHAQQVICGGAQDVERVVVDEVFGDGRDGGFLERGDGCDSISCRSDGHGHLGGRPRPAERRPGERSKRGFADLLQRVVEQPSATVLPGRFGRPLAGRASNGVGGRHHDDLQLDPGQLVAQRPDARRRGVQAIVSAG